MTEKFFSCLWLICLLVAVEGCAHKKPATVIAEEKSDYFGTTQVHRYKLANGLKVLILEDHSAPTFSYHTWFDVGSRDEQPGLTGLAHLFEHMMFKETKNRKDGEFDKMLESAGAEGENAFTSRDYTGYVQSLPSDKLELIANLESERMVNLLVNDDALAKEREVVQNERRFRYENSPNGLLYERVYEVSYGKHAYHWPVIGYEKDLNNASRKDCEAFYKRFYAPNNATIVVAGNVTPSKVIDVVVKYYAHLPTSPIERPMLNPEPPQKTERTDTIQIKSPVEKLVVGYHIPDVNHADFSAIEVARGILADGKGSRLYRTLVDGGIATSVDLESAEHKDPGLLLVFINLQKGKTAQQALKIVDREVRDMASGHITSEEIERAVSMHRYAVFDGLASNYSKAQFLGFYETVAGRFERGVQIMNELPSIKGDSIAKAVRAYFNKDNRSVVIGVPAKGK